MTCTSSMNALAESSSTALFAFFSPPCALIFTYFTFLLQCQLFKVLNSDILSLPRHQHTYFIYGRGCVYLCWLASIDLNLFLKPQLAQSFDIDDWCLCEQIMHKLIRLKESFKQIFALMLIDNHINVPVLMTFNCQYVAILVFYNTVLNPNHLGLGYFLYTNIFLQVYS